VDFHWSLPSPHDRGRVAHVWPPEVMPAITSAMAAAVIDELTLPADFTSPASLARTSPGGSGLAHGRALTRIGSMLAMGGELDGHRYLGPDTIAQAAREQSYAIDELFGPCRYGLGFGLDSEEFPAPTPSTFHWGGFGGSFLTVDPVSGVSCAFTPSQLRVEVHRGVEPRERALWQALGGVCRQLT